MLTFPIEYPQFLTATIHRWKFLLAHDYYKDIVIESMRFMVKDDRVRIFSFVIMSNHIHLIWQILGKHRPSDVQRDFLKFTAQQIKKDLRGRSEKFLQQFQVNKADREYQFWKKNSLSIELRTHFIFLQKMDYIHFNPVKARLCKYAEQYKYSSASFYETGIDNWGFLTHYND